MRTCFIVQRIDCVLNKQAMLIKDTVYGVEIILHKSPWIYFSFFFSYIPSHFSFLRLLLCFEERNTWCNLVTVMRRQITPLGSRASHWLISLVLQKLLSAKSQKLDFLYATPALFWLALWGKPTINTSMLFDKKRKRIIDMVKFTFVKNMDI